MTPTPTLENDGTFKLRLIATRAIKKGEEICTRYVPYKGDIFSRRKTLLEKWVRKINFSTNSNLFAKLLIHCFFILTALSLYLPNL